MLATPRMQNDVCANILKAVRRGNELQRVADEVVDRLREQHGVAASPRGRRIAQCEAETLKHRGRQIELDRPRREVGDIPPARNSSA